MEENERGSQKRARERDGGNRAIVLEEAEGCSSKGTIM